jgi:ankyrin repeat protein
MLGETYERILKEIGNEEKEHAHRLLQCLTIASRPPHIEELAEVFAVDFNTGGLIPKLIAGRRPKDPRAAILSACSSLVTIVNIDGFEVVQFSHLSVKEFLISDYLSTSTRSGRVSFYHILPEPAHTILAQACLGVLLQLDHHLDRDNLEKIPLAEYAAKHWVDHARFENVASRIREGMELLFDPEEPHFATWVRIYLGLPTPHSLRRIGTPLYYAALCGLPSLAEQLIAERPTEVNARGGRHVTAIQAALYKRHLPIVRLLIEHGADVNSQDDEGSSLLHIAAQIGDHEAASLLLSHGADVKATDSANAQDENRSTALHISSNNGDIDLVRLLLDNEAEVNHRDKHGSTPLHLASAKGKHSVVKLLVERGAGVNALDNTNSTPLHLASSDGYYDVVVLLMKHGANVNARDSENSTPLDLASAKGRLKVVELLKDAKDTTPLHVAPFRGPTTATTGTPSTS